MPRHTGPCVGRAPGRALFWNYLAITRKRRTHDRVPQDTRSCPSLSRPCALRAHGRAFAKTRAHGRALAGTRPCSLFCSDMARLNQLETMPKLNQTAINQIHTSKALQYTYIHHQFQHPSHTTNFTMAIQAFSHNIHTQTKHACYWMGNNHIWHHIQHITSIKPAENTSIHFQASSSNHPTSWENTEEVGNTYLLTWLLEF